MFLLDVINPIAIVGTWAIPVIAIAAIVLILFFAFRKKK